MDGPRDPRARGAGPRDGEPPGAASRTPRALTEEPRPAGGPGPGRQHRPARDRGLRSRGPRDRQEGRGPGALQKRPEPKLYALESVVDRGFEDVADETDESGTRRVHWAIIKRTVADQKSGKAMSAVYALQREGVDLEFPNLGAARAAVNKTIIHPEKLTLSKAEHAAAKK